VFLGGVFSCVDGVFCCVGQICIGSIHASVGIFNELLHCPRLDVVYSGVSCASVLHGPGGQSVEWLRDLESSYVNGLGNIVLSKEEPEHIA
jgi:hypothetical protein